MNGRRRFIPTVGVTLSWKCRLLSAALVELMFFVVLREEVVAK